MSIDKILESYAKEQPIMLSYSDLNIISNGLLSAYKEELAKQIKLDEFKKDGKPLKMSSIFCGSHELTGKAKRETIDLEMKESKEKAKEIFNMYNRILNEKGRHLSNEPKYIDVKNHPDNWGME